MSTFTGLNTMVRGIFNSQTALNTTGHNITNASTPGYSRQSANSVTTGAEYRTGLYGALAIGTGVEVQTITRSRDIFADKQYRNENSTQEYYEARAKTYDKLEVVLNDSGDVGLATSIGEFYKALVDLSTEASTNANRSNVVSKAKSLCDLMKTDTQEFQQQINAEYDDLNLQVIHVNQILEDIVNSNKLIMASEASGATANDLRDQRDLLVDELSKYLNINVTETSLGAYQINSGGTMLINSVDRLHLEFSDGIPSAVYGVDYGVLDHTIYIRESNQVFVPQNGLMKAKFDAIEECKSYIDAMASMANFLLTTFNDQHKAGYDFNGNEGINFFGETGAEYSYAYDSEQLISSVTVNDNGSTTTLTGVAIIEACVVNSQMFVSDSYNYVAAATRYAVLDKNGQPVFYESDGDLEKNKLSWVGGNVATDTGTVGVADGTNAVYLSELFNLSHDTIIKDGRSNAVVLMKYDKDYPTKLNAIDGLAFNDFYVTVSTDLAIDAEKMDINVEEHEGLMTQILNWRDSASGVDWNEELTNMIKFQKAYQSCARCLTAMDECLDRLVNNTGTVGR